MKPQSVNEGWSIPAKNEAPPQRPLTSGGGESFLAAKAQVKPPIRVSKIRSCISGYTGSCEEARGQA
jgi:hypothetical protein